MDINKELDLMLGSLSDYLIDDIWLDPYLEYGSDEQYHVEVEQALAEQEYETDE